MRSLGAETKKEGEERNSPKLLIARDPLLSEKGRAAGIGETKRTSGGLGGLDLSRAALSFLRS